MRDFAKLKLLFATAVLAVVASPSWAIQTGNVVFFHPDGTGANHWDALRLLKSGPDGEIEWDRLPAMATYTGHMKNSLAATSHGGATTSRIAVLMPVKLCLVSTGGFNRPQRPYTARVMSPIIAAYEGVPDCVDATDDTDDELWNSCLLSGVKRTSLAQPQMSAYDPKRT